MGFGEWNETALVFLFPEYFSWWACVMRPRVHISKAVSFTVG